MQVGESASNISSLFAMFCLLLAGPPGLEPGIQVVLETSELTLSRTYDIRPCDTSNHFCSTDLHAAGLQHRTAKLN